MTADLSKLDLLVVQIDGLHVSDDLVLVAAIGIDGDGGKRPLAVVEGATENTATVQTRDWLQSAQRRLRDLTLAFQPGGRSGRIFRCFRA